MPPLEDPVEVNCRPRKISCYNCGSNTHLGPECKEASMEEMTRSKFCSSSTLIIRGRYFFILEYFKIILEQYRLNYGGPSSTESKDGE